ncbi:hypothetical protein HK102_005131, partial [Quaeritorhiza haematococci]
MHLPPDLRLRRLRDLVERCPHIERIKVGWVRRPDDEDAYYDDPDEFEERLSVTALLDLIPTLKELDIDEVSGVAELRRVFKRLATLRCVRFNSSFLFWPTLYLRSLHRFVGLHRLVAALAERTRVETYEVLDLNVQLYDSGLVVRSEYHHNNANEEDLAWIRSQKFVAALPKMIKMPLSKLTVQFSDDAYARGTIAMLATPNFAFVRTASELCIRHAVDEYSVDILRLRFSGLKSLEIRAKNIDRPHGFPKSRIEIFGGKFEKLEQLSIAGAGGESGQYPAFWEAMKAGTLPPPPVNPNKVWLPFLGEESVTDLVSWVHRGKLRKLVSFDFCTPCHRASLATRESDSCEQIKKALKCFDALSASRRESVAEISLSWTDMNISEWKTHESCIREFLQETCQKLRIHVTVGGSRDELGGGYRAAPAPVRLSYCGRISDSEA